MSDQIKGLTNAARDFLEKHIPVCPHCEVPLSFPEKIGFFFNDNMETFPLFKYKLRSGEFAYEFLQVALRHLSPHPSGSVFYLGLRTSGRTYWWSDLS